MEIIKIVFKVLFKMALFAWGVCALPSFLIVSCDQNSIESRNITIFYGVTTAIFMFWIFYKMEKGESF